MYGAIIGDIVGSKYEFYNIKTKNFPFISRGCTYTDDTVMTVAVAKALLRSIEEGIPFKGVLIQEMQQLGRKYPSAGYGGMFTSWIRDENPQPYNSFGNGSAMRVSPCGLIAVTLEEAITLARVSAGVTHNHPEGIKGAEATAAAIFLARTGKSMEEIGDCIRNHYYYLSQTLDEIRPTYRFDVTCQGTVPQAIIAFLESTGYEDAIRNAVSIGGDSDTLAAITGAIAWSYYRFRDRDGHTKEGCIRPEFCEKIIAENNINSMLPEDFVTTIEQFDIACTRRAGTYDRSGFCSPIIPE